jgi:hypothetical protein
MYEAVPMSLAEAAAKGPLKMMREQISNGNLKSPTAAAIWNAVLAV